MTFERSLAPWPYWSARTPIFIDYELLLLQSVLVERVEFHGPHRCRCGQPTSSHSTTTSSRNCRGHCELSPVDRASRRWHPVYVLVVRGTDSLSIRKTESDERRDRVIDSQARESPLGPCPAVGLRHRRKLLSAPVGRTRLCSIVRSRRDRSRHGDRGAHVLNRHHRNGHTVAPRTAWVSACVCCGSIATRPASAGSAKCEQHGGDSCYLRSQGYRPRCHVRDRLALSSRSWLLPSDVARGSPSWGLSRWRLQ